MNINSASLNLKNVVSTVKVSTIFSSWIWNEECNKLDTTLILYLLNCL